MNYLMKFKNQFGSVSRKYVAATAVTALVFSVFVPITKANHDPFGGVPQTSVLFCHQLGNDDYNEPNASVTATGGQVTIPQGHAGHDGDIIPPFHFDGGSYPGQNWTAETEDIWNSGACDGDGVIDPEPETGFITLVKVLAGDATDDVVADWTLTATGPDTISGVTDAGAVTAAQIEVGSYTLSESGPTTNYSASSWVCVDDAQAPVTVTASVVTLAADEEITCTITNTYDAPDTTPDTGTLTLVKHVAGSQVSSDHWTLTATGSNDTITGLSGTAAVTDAVVEAGNYDLSEVGLGGYSASAWSCIIDNIEPTADLPATMVDADTVTVQAFHRIVCTITNTLINENTPHADLGITKTVDNSSVSSSGDQVTFTITVTNTESEGGDTAHAVVVNDLLPAGFTYVSATPDADYDEVTGIWTVGDLAPGASAVLTITVTVTDDATNHACVTSAERTVDPNSENDCADSSVTIETSGGGGSSGGSRSGSSRNPGRVLGDFTGLQYQAPTPQVLGATTELPRTGSPVEVYALFAFLALLAATPVFTRKSA